MDVWRVQSVSRGKLGRSHHILWSFAELCKCFHGQPHRPDVEAIVASGLFEECVAGIEAVADGGTTQLHDVAGYPLLWALRLLLNCHSHPKCEARIRGMATALEFCLEPKHDIVLCQELHITTASIAASIGEPASAMAQSVVHRLANNHAPAESLAVSHAVCAVFGRDEAGSNEGRSEFRFNQPLIDLLVTKWSDVVRAKGFYATFSLSSDTLMAEELCISDR